MKKKSIFKSEIVSLLGTIATGILLSCMFNHFFMLSKVVGYSMAPTACNGAIVLSTKNVKELKHKDIIVTEPMNIDELDGDKSIIKRVIGLEGDTVEISCGRLYVNDKMIVEPYAMCSIEEMSKITVPEGYVFVMGDNRPASLDSRKLGPIPLEKIAGKALFLLDSKRLDKTEEVVY